MKVFFQILLVTSTLAVNSCASYPPTRVENAPKYSDSEYEALFQTHTQSTERYKGVQNTMIVHATLISPTLGEALLARKARIYQWDQSEYDDKLAEMRSRLGRKTQFFVSLFTPEKNLNNLVLNDDLWTVLFETAEGTKLKADIEKLTGEFEELGPFYPTHNRFSQAYIISFPQSTMTLENQNKLTLTGPVDSATLTFTVE